MSNNGHTIKISLELLQLRMVELWRSGNSKNIPEDYSAKMLRYTVEYAARTGKSCNTVGQIANLEEWYDGLTEDQKTELKFQYEVVAL